MTHQPDPTDDPGTQSPPDPWKSFRGVMAGTLILEAIVVLLALPVVNAVGGGLTTASLAYLIGLAAVLVLLAGLQGRSWAIWVNLAVQLVPIVGFVVYPGVGFIGVLFAAVWVLIAYFRAEVRWRQQRGLLPGQTARPHRVGERPQRVGERPQRVGPPLRRGGSPLRRGVPPPACGGVPPPAGGGQQPPD